MIRMKKIVFLFSAYFLLAAACTGSKNLSPAASPDTVTAVEAAVPTASDFPTAPNPDSISEVDAASGATSVPNQPTFNGLLVVPPQDRATVTLTMGGAIRTASLLPGDYVTRGTVLATLENPEFITLQQVYLESHAQNEYLRAEFRRQQTLAREEVASQKRFQQSRAEYLSMRSRMEAAAAQLALLGVDTLQLLERGIVPCIEVKAPISGHVADVQMNLGRHFGAGEPLCEIVNKDHMMLRLTAYEKDLAHLHIGDRVEFRINGMEPQLFQGTVAVVGQQVNNANRSIEVYVRIADQDPQFRPGMYAVARIVRK